MNQAKPTRPGTSDDGLGRRSSARYSVSIPSTLTAGDTVQTCTVVNLSLGGASVFIARDLVIGDRVHVVFSVPAPRQLLDAMATVRWASETTYGIQFDGLRAIEVWAVGKYLEQLRESERAGAGAD